MGTAEIEEILSAASPDEIEAIRRRAEQVLLENVGDAVHYRGLVEFSNICSMNCLYCGIRSGNRLVNRYMMSEAEILDSAMWCAEAGYGSIVLQSGERRDPEFVEFVVGIVSAIKRKTVSPDIPEGLGVTLCVGEQTLDVYRRFREAGAHRYLLRVETSDPGLFVKIHPVAQTLASRIRALEMLREAGFQVGTGVMIGLPGQTIKMLAADIVFMKRMDIGMIGMGPYIPHNAAPMAEWVCGEWTQERTFRTALLMIAAARMDLKDVNIAATTALQAIDPVGREEGLRFGANVIMPQLTPLRYRSDYLLYENKPCIDEDRGKCRKCLEGRIHSVGRKIGLNEWGDAPHYTRRGH